MITTRYTFLMEEIDEDTGETICELAREVSTDALTDVLDTFLKFLWGATFTYVRDVTALTNTGEISTEI